jgi:hypothetical protein
MRANFISMCSLFSAMFTDFGVVESPQDDFQGRRAKQSRHGVSLSCADGRAASSLRSEQRYGWKLWRLAGNARDNRNGSADVSARTHQRRGLLPAVNA